MQLHLQADMSIVEQFRKEHGVPVMDDSGWWIFSDGARMEASPAGAMTLAPADPRHRFMLQRKYWEIRVRQAEQNLKEFNQQVVKVRGTGFCKGVFYTPEDVEPRLKILNDVIAVRRRRLASVLRAAPAGVS
jgi:hypothetical protein